MSGILNESPISSAELKEHLERIKKRDGELNFRANKTLEYLNHFDIPKDYKELSEAITQLKVPRLKDSHIKKIIDVRPKTVEELKVILQGYPISINNENLKKIVDVVTKA